MATGYGIGNYTYEKSEKAKKTRMMINRRLINIKILYTTFYEDYLNIKHNEIIISFDLIKQNIEALLNQSIMTSQNAYVSLNMEKYKDGYDEFINTYTGTEELDIEGKYSRE